MIRDHGHDGADGDAAAADTHLLLQVAVENWSVLRHHFRLAAAP